jgi:hypothetical protein
MIKSGVIVLFDCLQEGITTLQPTSEVVYMWLAALLMPRGQ